MSTDMLLVDMLESKEAERMLKGYEDTPDPQMVREFWELEGWRILRHEGLYIEKIPIWVLLDAYQLTLKELEIFFDVLLNLDIYEKESSTPLSLKTKEEIVRSIRVYGDAVYKLPYDEKLLLIKEDMQHFMASIYRLEIIKDAAQNFLNLCGLVQKKAVHGLPMPQLVSPYIHGQQQVTASPATQNREVQSEVAPASDEQQDLQTVDVDEALRLAGEWYAAEPDNMALHVGLLLIYGKSLREVFCAVWRVKVSAKEFTDSNKGSVRFQRTRFLKLAKKNGYDFSTYVKC